ncbi:hypothetical protein AAIA72_12985 [Hahella sp. SMD15-11]|uniref:Uncharacterized protein n=1 Tax=Thermohahella caldifontis TaxID=3142973 RepID=A0AB39UUH6_9GAMM
MSDPGIHDQSDNNQYHTGSGLTLNRIAESGSQSGAVKTPNFERHEINLRLASPHFFRRRHSTF